METLATLTSRSQIAMDDLKAQNAICRELSKRINSEPALLPVYSKAEKRLALLESRYKAACAKAWDRHKKEVFGWE
jgi:hypothetical protein